MIDLDRAPFETDQEFEAALKDTLQNIKEHIIGTAGRYPTVIWSGNGYHIPLTGWQKPLEEMPEFDSFKDQDLSNMFLRWAERRLTNGKADHNHNQTIKSCLFKIPGTVNTKAMAAGKNPLVKIVQGKYVINETISPPRTAAHSSRPTGKFLNDFHAYIVEQEIDEPM